MKFAAQVGSGAMIYVKNVSAIQKLIWGDTHTYRQHGNHISLF
jgi:hypothetical protein